MKAEFVNLESMRGWDSSLLNRYNAIQKLFNDGYTSWMLGRIDSFIIDSNGQFVFYVYFQGQIRVRFTGKTLLMVVEKAILFCDKAPRASRLDFDLVEIVL